ncbi:glycerol-3-phosphate dehydrogenase (NAD(P)+) [Tranquillimonas rosea]|uniref:Glycerol-3-phosphate dehydrogenase [NAD(P)+] n=1 Tax=Tranquillimonas rosea TaxID=641238 RepID=A0A1H9WC37_9RHOB|nr:NAD(P)H-dependent glycerol-3-phosphate dehydrogenase [Tranquillimonas rosea]SES31395.1 glycerol-3-phosphate dehydrogenase (NAD(P)+) [Tranquillimonas rosea]
MSVSGIPSSSFPAHAHPYDRIAVIGAGSWGTALATVARRAGREVTVWGRDAATMSALSEQRENPRYLPGVELPPGLKGTTDIAEALGSCRAVMIVTPSKTLRNVCRQMREHLPQDTPIAICAKGIEAKTGYLLTEVAAEELPGHPVGAISGPTFAKETVLGYPTAATVAFPFTYKNRLEPQDSPAARFAISLSSELFRPYISDDVVGVEIGGAVKNVIAIACGMMMGAGFAENTRAALIARGMDEMKTLAEVLGGRRETVTGLSGAGDLTLTCSSETSRNMSLGVQLGRGLDRSECFEGKNVVVEGEVNAISVIDLAARIGVSLPICESVHAVLHRDADLKQTFRDLWSRPIESEPKALEISLNHPFGQTTGPAE